MYIICYTSRIINASWWNLHHEDRSVCCIIAFTDAMLWYIIDCIVCLETEMPMHNCTRNILVWINEISIAIELGPSHVLAVALDPLPLSAAALGPHCSLWNLRRPNLTLDKLRLRNCTIGYSCHLENCHMESRPWKNT